MAKPVPKRGFQPVIVDAVGPLPLGDDPKVVLKAILERRRAYHQNGPGDPLADQSFLMLAHAGLLSEGLGGNVLLQRMRGGKIWRLPILREPLELLGRFFDWQSGGCELAEIDLKAVEGLVKAGLEAYGFALPEPEKPRGRPAKSFGAETVRAAVIRKYRHVLAGRVSIASIVRDCAADAILERNRAAAEKHGRDPEKVTLMEADAQDLEYERRKLEVAYKRLAPLTDAQILAHRNHLAWLYRTTRRHIKTKDDFCAETAATVGD